jgi:predicted DNA-binding transcriptional regulator YafY
VTATAGILDVMTDSPGTSGRLLRLLSLLQARRDWPGGVLAERLDVSPRTVRRDVDRLRDLGYPVRAIKGPDGGYRLDAGAELPPLLFDDEQAVAVAVALQTASAGVSGIEEGALRALATVRQVMPARLRGRVDALRVTTVPTDREQPKVDSEVLIAVGAAVRAREVLRFDYSGRTGLRRAGPPTRPRRRLGGSNRTIWPPGAAGGTWSPSIWTAPTGAPSGSTG